MATARLRGSEDAEAFSRWTLGLPSSEELTPLDQTLISPALACAFSIAGGGGGNCGAGGDQGPSARGPTSGHDAHEASASGHGRMGGASAAAAAVDRAPAAQEMMLLPPRGEYGNGRGSG
eukprot:SM005839S18327  [mRNA]  locus=s5839:42:890:+ [translate_table: standard]